MVLRKLWSWEWEKLRLHLLRLETADRRLRFCRLVRDDFIHDYCDEIDRMQTTVVGCFVDDVLRGAAELVRLAGTVPVSAEIALSVEGPFQGLGIGGKLLERALLLARNRFVDTVHMYSLRENPRIQHLVRKFGASVESFEATSEGQIHLPWPSQLSLMEEVAGDGQAFITAVFEVPTYSTGLKGNASASAT